MNTAETVCVANTARTDFFQTLPSWDRQESILIHIVTTGLGKFFLYHPPKQRSRSSGINKPILTYDTLYDAARHPLSLAIYLKSNTTNLLTSSRLSSKFERHFIMQPVLNISCYKQLCKIFQPSLMSQTKLILPSYSFATLIIINKIQTS